MIKMIKQKTLNLLFPQWQGSGDTKELFYGAKKVGEHLCKKINFTEIAVSTNTINEIQNGIYAYSSIIEHLNKTNNIIKAVEPDRILTVGGDCGVELAPVSFLNKQYTKDFAVIWFDAHGDLNIPEESLSHHFHGMPLRSLLGDGDKKIIQSCFSKISPNQIILVGGRDFDQAEQDFIKMKGINSYSVSQVTMKNKDLIELIERTGFHNLYIHIDLDVLDPVCFPYVKCPTKGGLSFETLIKTVSALTSRFNTVGISIVEFSPVGDYGIEYIEELIRISGFI